MKKLMVALMVVVITSFSTNAQNVISVIRGQALEMVRALQKKDVPTLLKYIHPKMLEMAGGTDKLIRQMDTMKVMAKQFGAEIKRINIGMPEKIVTYKKEMQTVIPETTELTSAFGDLSLETSLVVISSDDGKTWKFIDTGISSVKDLRKAMPELSPELIIPSRKEPKFTPR
ncbi:MAG: hypothetical protein ABI151_11845 [Chitinophagaceae bacterium]